MGQIHPRPNQGNMPETALDIIDDTDQDIVSLPPIDRDKLFNLRATKGLSLSEIGKLTDVPKSTVFYYVKRWNIPTSKQLSRFKDNRADLFADQQRRIADTIDDECIKKASLVQRSTTICQFYDKERLERDLSTNNVSVMHASDYAKDIADLDAAYEELSAK